VIFGLIINILKNVRPLPGQCASGIDVLSNLLCLKYVPTVALLVIEPLGATFVGEKSDEVAIAVGSFRHGKEIPALP
jgi:hypothetical protein